MLLTWYFPPSRHVGMHATVLCNAMLQCCNALDQDAAMLQCLELGQTHQLTVQQLPQPPGFQAPLPGF